MREVLFRAWYKGTAFPNKMYEVRNLYFYDGDVYAVLVDGKQELGNMQIGTECDLMQYIGLDDVAGEGIFEGDILGMDNATAKVVYWEQPPEFGLDFSHNEDEWCEDWNLSDGHAIMEIVGNIYENSKLLEVR